MNIDRLMIKGPAENDFVPVDDMFGFYLKWRKLTAPKQKESYDDIPGMNGSLDSTEEYGEIFYNMRSLALDCVHPNSDWYEDYQRFMDAYHAQDVKIAFSNDPEYYWAGRLSVSEYDAKSRSIIMSALVYPYKFKRLLTKVSASVTTTKTVKLVNGRMKVVPDVTFSAPITLAWGTYTKALSASSYPATVRIAGLELLPNSSISVTITGAADVTFSYREGAL